MKFGAVVEVEETADGVRVRARDWPYAPWLAALLIGVGLPVFLWAAFGPHTVELGGGLVFMLIGDFCLRRTIKERRELELRRDGGSVRLKGVEGCGPYRREVDEQLGDPVAVEIRAFEAPEGAPDLPDRGGDLVVEAGGTRFRLARGVGRRRAELEAARDRIRAALSATAGA